MQLLKSMTYEKAALEDITEITDTFESELDALDGKMKSVIQLNIAIDEIYSNIVKYAYPDGGPAQVTLSFEPETRMASVVFSDSGVPFNPLAEEAPDITVEAENRDIGGLGIFLLKKTMDTLTYSYTDGKNVLTIGKII